jgi:hypothetical protein
MECCFFLTEGGGEADIADLLGILFGISTEYTSDEVSASRINAHYPRLLQRALLEPALVDCVRVSSQSFGLHGTLISQHQDSCNTGCILYQSYDY